MPAPETSRRLRAEDDDEAKLETRHCWRDRVHGCHRARLHHGVDVRPGRPHACLGCRADGRCHRRLDRLGDRPRARPRDYGRHQRGVGQPVLWSPRGSSSAFMVVSAPDASSALVARPPEPSAALVRASPAAPSWPPSPRLSPRMEAAAHTRPGPGAPEAARSEPPPSSPRVRQQHSSGLPRPRTRGTAGGRVPGQGRPLAHYPVARSPRQGA